MICIYYLTCDIVWCYVDGGKKCCDVERAHINFINRENPISVLYSTYFHPQRNTFPPFPRPLWDAPAHAERTRAALDSPKANAVRGTRVPSQPPVNAAWQGTRPTVICCEVADKNQYNKLLGVVRITVQESGSDWFTTVNYSAF